jgi:hypothetical protein
MEAQMAYATLAIRPTLTAGTRVRRTSPPTWRWPIFEKRWPCATDMRAIERKKLQELRASDAHRIAKCTRSRNLMPWLPMWWRGLSYFALS